MFTWINYFTSFHLLAHLGEHNIHAKHDITSDKQLQKKVRGYTEQKISTNKSSRKSQLLDGMIIVLST